MAKIKKSLSLFLAVLMVMSMFGGMNIAGATLSYNSTPISYDTRKDESTEQDFYAHIPNFGSPTAKTYAQLSAEYGNTPFVYYAIEVYHEDGTLCSDGKITPGEVLTWKYYVKSNYRIAGELKVTNYETYDMFCTPYKVNKKTGAATSNVTVTADKCNNADSELIINTDDFEEFYTKMNSSVYTATVANDATAASTKHPTSLRQKTSAICLLYTYAEDPSDIEGFIWDYEYDDIGTWLRSDKPICEITVKVKEDDNLDDDIVPPEVGYIFMNDKDTHNTQFQLMDWDEDDTEWWDYCDDYFNPNTEEAAELGYVIDAEEMDGIVFDSADANSKYTTASVIPTTSYKASFTTSKGTAPADVTADQNGKVTLPAALSAEGFQFMGWRATGTSAIIEAGTQVTITANTTYEAVWGGKVTFLYKGTPVQDTTIELGQAVTAPSMTSYADFTGWDKTVVTPCAGDATYTAQIAATKYTVTFTDPSGTYAADTQEITEGENVTAPNWTRTGYDLSWNPAVVNPVTAAAAYTAVWTPKTYTVTLNANGGACDTSTVNVTYNSTYGTLPVPTKVGYTFGGWFAGQTEVTAATAVTEAADGQTLTAAWTANDYTVHFWYDDGTSTLIDAGTKTVTYGTAIGEPEDFTPVAGYTYAPFNAGNLTFTEEPVAGAEINKQATVTKTTYTVTYIVNGVSSNATKVFDDDIYYAAENGSMVFTGWKVTSANETHALNEIISGSTTLGIGDITLEAEFTDITSTLTYTVYAPNGTVFATDSIADVPLGANIATIINFALTGDDAKTYELGTWNIETMPGEAATAVMTLSYKPYTITFKDGNTIVDTVAAHYGDALDEIAPEYNPEIAGKTFAGWGYSDGATVTESYIYTAQYNDWEVEVYLERPDGSEIGDYPYIYTYGEAITFPADAEVFNTDYPAVGYTYKWTDASGEEVASANAIVEAEGDSLYFIAEFTAKKFLLKFSFDPTPDNVTAFPANGIAVAYGESLADAIKDYPAPQKTGYSYTSYNIAEGETMTEAGKTISTTGTKNKYTVYFLDKDKNEIKKENGDSTAKLVEFDSLLSAVEKPNYTVDGYDITWKIYKDAQCATSLGSLTKMPAYDIYIWASTAAGSANVTLTVKVENTSGVLEEAEGSPYSATVTTGDTITAATFNVSTNKTGFHIDEDNSTLSTTAAPGAALTIIFKRNEYTIKCYDGETEIGTTASKKYGAEIAAPAFVEKTGNTQTGWTYYNADTEAVVSSLPGTMPAYNIKAVANYTINSYDLKYVVNGTTYTYKNKLNYGAPVLESYLDSKTPAGQRFDKWYADSEFKTAYNFEGATMPAENLTIYGNNEAIKYTIVYKYYKDGVYASADDVTVTDQLWNAAIEAKNANDKYEGYKFKNGSTYTVIDSTVPVGQNDTITITYNYEAQTFNAIFKDGDSTYKTVPTKYNATIAVPDEPIKTGYSFNFWKDAPEGAEVEDFTMPAEDVTFYADWTVEKYTAKFYDGDNLYFETAEMDYGTEFVLSTLEDYADPSDETEAMIFSGWKLGNAEAASTATFTMGANDVYTAVWTYNTEHCRVQNVEMKNHDKNEAGYVGYFDRGIRQYEITFQDGTSPRRLYVNGNGQEMIFNKSQYMGGDTECGIISIVEATATTPEVWVVELLLPAGDYRFFCQLQDATIESSESGYPYTSVYDVKDEEEVKTDIISVGLAADSGTLKNVVQNEVAYSVVARGDYLVWTVETDESVTWLRFVGTYDTEADGQKTSTTLYKRANAGESGSNFTITDNVWTIRMRFSYSVADASVAENWVLSYKKDTGSTWYEYGEAANIIVARDVNAVANDEEVQEYAPYSIISAEIADVTPVGTNYTVDLNSTQTIKVVTTSDVTRVRVKVGTKTSTYQTTSKYNVEITENEDGTLTWEITYKIAKNGLYEIQVRGEAWSEAATFTVGADS